MPGSSQSISGLNFALNTMVAESLCNIADKLEKSDDIDKTIEEYVANTLHNHGRIIFNGNNYSEEWAEEAARRGLPNLKNTPLARREFINEKNIALLTKHGILTKEEMYSRYEINMENYTKTINIEALTMIDMAKREILPAVLKYSKSVFKSLALKKSSGLALDLTAEETYAATLSDETAKLFTQIKDLEAVLAEKDETDIEATALYMADEVLPAMNELRSIADSLETMVPEKVWPFPTYTDLLFNVWGQHIRDSYKGRFIMAKGD